MLFIKTIEPNTLSILKRLQSLPKLENFDLVGGTALALKYGHRLSIDLDLFGKIFEKDEIITSLNEEFGQDFSFEKTPDEWAIFCFIDNIKVDIIKYPHPLVAPIETLEGIRISSTEDIAAMKTNAILGSASKKDFWDIYELLHHYSLAEIIGFHIKKYPNQMLLISIPQALCYFEEAEESESPISLKNQTWNMVKDLIKARVNDYLK